MKRTIDELLGDLSEIERLLEASEANRYLKEIYELADWIARTAPDDGIAVLADRLKNLANGEARDKPPRRTTLEVMKDAAFRLKISLLALKRGGSPPD